MLQIQSWRMHARDDLWHVREFRLRTDCDRRPIVAVRQAAWGTPILTLNECGSRKSRKAQVKAGRGGGDRTQYPTRQVIESIHPRTQTWGHLGPKGSPPSPLHYVANRR